MKRVMTTVCGMLAICGMVLLGAARSQAQGTTTTLVATVQEVRPTAASTQSAPVSMAELPGAGSPQAGYGVGVIHIDNHTRYYIRIYVDGDYIGTVAPGGDLYRRAEVASYRVSATAVFDDGTEYTWGPRTLYVNDDETSTWTLVY